MRILRSFPSRAIASICLMVAQLVWLPASHADKIPVTKLAYREIKLADHSGKPFALGFKPFEADKLYWTADQSGVARLYTYDIGTSTLAELAGVIPSSFLPSGFTWSPDGRQAALIQGPVLKLVGIDIHKTQNLFLGTNQWGPMFWTPNHFILTTCAPDARVARKLCAIGTSTGLVTGLVAPGEGSLYAVGYIEGANKLIYERWNPGEGPNPMHLYTASIFSDHVGNLVPLSYPDISNEGYVTVTPDGGYGVTLGRAPQAKDKGPDVYLGNFGTGDWTRVPSPADGGRPVMALLSPDHRHLVVITSGGKDGYRLWLADVPERSLDPAVASH